MINRLYKHIAENFVSADNSLVGQMGGGGPGYSHIEIESLVEFFSKETGKTENEVFQEIEKYLRKKV